MLIYSMGVSVDGFIADRAGAFGWTVPNEEQFRFHIAQTRELGGYLCGRRLYETMLPWETDPSMRDNELGAAFADVWCAIPKVVFSRTLDGVQGNARLAEASVAEEAAAARPAPPISTSLSVAASAASASCATGASASRALPWTLSSVRLKTTFGSAHQTSANLALSSVSRSDGSVSHTSIVS